MSQVILTAASQEWWKRPDDERFLTLEELLNATTARAKSCRVEVQANKDVIARSEGDEIGAALTLYTPSLGMLRPNHWSFGQLASAAGCPAKWLRALGGHHGGTSMAAYAINYGLQMLAEKDSVQVMGMFAGEPGATLRCITGRDYGRIYDRDVVKAVMEVNRDGRWHVPAASYAEANPKRATTLYASDRNVFIFLVDNARTIDVRVGDSGEVRHLHRGFYTWNSEVGDATFGLTTFLYDRVCDNRTIWGAEDVRTFTVRHTSGAPEGFAREARPMLVRYANSSDTEVRNTLERSTRFQVGKNDEEVMAWLRRASFTKTESEQIVNSARETEGDARTLWQIVNGGTAKARGMQHTDDRVAFEKRVSGLLGRAAA